MKCNVVAFSALTLLVWHQKSTQPVKFTE